MSLICVNNTPDFDREHTHAVLTVTPTMMHLLEYWSGMAKALKEIDSRFYSIEILTPMVEFGQVPDEDFDIEPDEWLKLPDDWDGLKLVRARTDCETARFCGDRVYWSAYPKHGGAREIIETPPIYYTQFSTL